MKQHRRLFVCQQADGRVYATPVLAQGDVLAPLCVLDRNEWLYDRFPASVLIVTAAEPVGGLL